MKLTIACIGRAGRGPERDLYELYAGRIRWPLTLRELEEKKKLPPAELVRREGELLLGAVPDKAVLVVLDRRGKVVDSEAFAQRLGRWRDDGVADVAFLIGGADGHGEAAKAKAALTLSFGKMTWPHQVVRMLLTEQLYRAATIIAGHPYHRV